MHWVVTISALLISVAAATWSGIIFKITAEQATWSGRLWFFAIGLGIGALVPLFQVLALRGNNPNVVFALFAGVGTVAGQVALVAYFKHQLTWWQWLGIGVVCVGVLLLQFAREVPLSPNISN